MISRDPVKRAILEKSVAAGLVVLFGALFGVPAVVGESPPSARAQDKAPVGYIAKDRIVELAKAADPSLASFTPSAAAVASFLALVDPVHVRMFICASRPADLKLAAAVGLAADAAANPVLTVEFVAVTNDLSEPSGLITENAVTKAPEIIVYWMDQEVARLHPEPGAAIDTDLAEAIFQARTQVAQDMILDREFFKFTYHKDLTALDCKRCHGPAGRERTLGSDHQKGRGAARSGDSARYLEKGVSRVAWVRNIKSGERSPQPRLSANGS